MDNEPCPAPFTSEIFSLIASWLPINCFGSLALTSRGLRKVVDRERYSVLRIRSFKQLVGLCEIFLLRPSAAVWTRRLVIDWDNSHRRENYQPRVVFFPAFKKLVSRAARHASNLASLKVVNMGHDIPLEVLSLLAPCARELILHPDEGLYDRFGHEEFELFFPSLPHLSNLQVLSPIPRSRLRSVMSSLNNVALSSLTLTHDYVDFGVIQEITLHLKRPVSALSELRVAGLFVTDPYKSTFFKDLPGILRRVPSLTLLAFGQTTEKQSLRTPGDPAWPIPFDTTKFDVERFIIDLYTPHPSLVSLVFPTGTRWVAWYDVMDDSKAWEPSSECRSASERWEQIPIEKRRIGVCQPPKNPGPPIGLGRFFSSSSDEAGDVDEIYVAEEQQDELESEDSDSEESASGSGYPFKQLQEDWVGGGVDFGQLEGMMNGNVAGVGNGSQKVTLRF